MEKIYNFFLRIETLNRAAFVMMLSVLFVGQVWGESEIITWDGKSLNGSGGTHVSAGLRLLLMATRTMPVLFL